MERFFKFILFSALMATVMVFATSCGFDRAVHDWLYPEYETYEVRYVMQRGDTVWEVAEHYYLQQNKINNLNEFVYSVRYRNGLTQSRRVVRSGDVIIIPLSIKK